MRNFLILFVFLFSITCFSSEGISKSLNDKYNRNITFITDPTMLDTTIVINKIDEEKAIIDSSINNLRKVEKDIYGLSAEGGIIKTYYDKDNLKKFELTFYGETGKAVKEYYINSGKVILIIIKEFYYDKPIYIEGSKVDKVIYNKYYLFENKLLKWIDETGISKNLKVHDYSIQEKTLLEEYEKYLSLMTSPK